MSAEQQNPLPAGMEATPRRGQLLRTRVIRALGRFVRRLLVGVALFVLIVGVMLQIPPTSTLVGRTVLKLANPWPGTSVSIGAVRGNWFSSLSLTDVRIAGHADSLLISIDTLRVSYDLFALFGNTLHFRQVYISRPIVRTRFMPEGALVFLRPFASSDTVSSDTSKGLKVRGDHLQVTNGEFALIFSSDARIHRFEVQDIQLRADSVLVAGSVAGRIDTLHSLAIVDGQADREIQLDAAGTLSKDLVKVRSFLLVSARSRVTGTGYVPLPFSPVHSLPGTELRFSASPISYSDLHLFLPGFGPDGEARIDLVSAPNADSSLTNLHIQFPGGGTIAVRGKAFTTTGDVLHVDITGATQRFSPSSVLGKAYPSDSILAKFAVEGAGRSPADFVGTVNVAMFLSGVAGIGPTKGSLNAVFRQGEVHAKLRGDSRSVLVSAEARLTPFALAPSYDVVGSITVHHPSVAGDLWERLDGLAAQFAFSGRGIDPDSARARATVRGKWTGNRWFSSLLVNAEVDRDSISASGNLVTATGSIHMSAEAVLAGTPGYRVHIPVFRSVSLAAFGTDLPQSSLTGSFLADVSGTSLATITGTASFNLDSSKIENVIVQSLQSRVAFDNGRVHLVCDAQSDAGSISFRGTADPYAGSPSVALEEARFERVNLQKILGPGGMPTNLNGTAQLRATARSMRDITLLMRDSLRGSEGSIQASGRVMLNASSFNKQAIRTATISVSLLDTTLESSIEILTPQGGVKGRAEAYPFGNAPAISVPELTLDHLDIGALSGSSGFHTDLTARIDGALRGESIDQSTGNLSIDFSTSKINGVMLEEGSLRATVESGRFSVRSIDDFPEGHAALDAGGQLTRQGVRGNLSLDISLRDSIHRRGADSLLPSEFLLRGSLEGAWGSPTETDLRGTLMGRGSYHGLRIDTLLCAVAVQGRTLHIDTVDILSNAASIAAGGTLALFDSTSMQPSDFSLSVNVKSLQPLEALLGLPPTLLRSATLSLGASGPPERTAVHCTTSVSSAALGDLAAGSLQGSLDMLLGPSAMLRSMDGKADVEGFRYGFLAVENASLSVHSVGNKYDVVSLVNVDRESSIRLAGSIRDDSDSLVILIESLTAASPGATWNLAQRASIVYGPRIVVRDFALHSGSRDVTVRGILNPKGDQDFEVSADSLDVKNIGKILGRPGLDGLVFLKARIEGPAENAHATGDLSVTLRSGGEELGDLSAHADWKAKSLAIDGRIQQPGGGRFSIAARLPLALHPPEPDVTATSAPSDSTGVGQFDVLLKAERFNLAFFRPVLSPRTIRSLSGALTADIHATGSLKSIAAVGSVSIDSGRIGITPLGVVYSGVQIHCTATGDTLRIDDAQARSGEGILHLNGVIELKNPMKPEVNVKATADKFLAVQTPELKANITGEVLLTGGGGTLTVAGTLALNDSYIVVPEAGKEGSVETVELTEEDYAMLLRYFGYRQQVATAEEGPSVVEPTIDLTLEMRQNTWIRKRQNPTLAIALQGSVKIERRPGQPIRLVGTLRPVAGRSYVGQFGRQFEVKSGEIVFKGPLEESELHMESEYEVPSKSGSGLSEVIIRMKVESNLGRFVFSLTSDPAMDESEILSYLATGQSKTGALANTADQGGLAGAMAVEQLVGMAGGLTEGSVPVDVFQIRQDGARGITIVAGNYVNPKTYLGIRQPILFSQGTQDSYYDTRTQYELEYEAQSWLFLNLQGGSSRTLLFLKARYAY